MINENGYTLEDIDELITYIEDDAQPWHTLSQNNRDLIIDALEFYKEMQYTNG